MSRPNRNECHNESPHNEARPYITAKAICPSCMKTEKVADNDPETERVLLDEIALKRFGTPGEVARSAVFLAF